MATSSLWQKALKVFPGGVNSPVRSFKGVGGEPVFMASGSGAHLTDTRGNTYLDYVGSWGPLLVGHAAPEVLDRLRQQMRKGLGFGTPCEAEIELAELILERLPDSLDQLRFVSSGTEAGMTAIRLARGITGRDIIVKFAGGYHGHSDSLLVQAGSGASTIGVRDSAGVPEALAQLTRVLPFNDAQAVRHCFDTQGDRIAAVLVEPVAGNMGMIPPVEGFIQQLRDCCSERGSVLIFDEVMTGFRVAWGGATEWLGVVPDLMMLGKVIGGGLPVGAVAGPQRLMAHLAPEGGVYQAGTLSGNPLAMAAGSATLQLATRELYPQLEAFGRALVTGLEERAARYGVPFSGTARGGMFGLFFTAERPCCLEEVAGIERYAEFFHLMLQQGIYLPPSAYESGFVSRAHTAEHLEYSLQAAGEVFKGMQP